MNYPKKKQEELKAQELFEIAEEVEDRIEIREEINRLTGRRTGYVPKLIDYLR